MGEQNQRRWLTLVNWPWVSGFRAVGLPLLAACCLLLVAAKVYAVAGARSAVLSWVWQEAAVL